MDSAIVYSDQSRFVIVESEGTSGEFDGFASDIKLILPD
jgi:hypothetical protein